MNDTMHFQGLLEDPTDPKMVIFKKQQASVLGGADPYGRGPSDVMNSYQNEHYQNQHDNPASYQDFQRQFPAQDPTATAPTHAFSAQSAYSGARHRSEAMSAHEAGRRGSAHDEAPPSNRSYMNKTQAEMWSEFNAHFRNRDRPVVKVNHHDFLDGNFLSKLK